MSFSVEPDALRDLARDLDELGTACSEAVSYAGFTRPNVSGGSAMVRLLNSTTDVKPTVEEFRHLKSITEASADEVVATYRYYRDTDTQAAARVDSTYPTDRT